MGGTGTFGYRLGKDQAGAQQIDGLKELQRDLKKLGDDAKNDMKPAHMKAAELVVMGAKRYVPYRTGRLLESLRPFARQKAGVVRAGSASVPYAGPIHFGWPARRIKPQPFIYDALDQRRAEVVNIYAERMGELINKYELGPSGIKPASGSGTLSGN
jgi:HK97 gp10 family phage protein